MFGLYRRKSFAEYSANRAARMVALVLDRRTFIGAATAAAAALVAACSPARSRSASSPGSSGSPSNATEPLSSAPASAGPPSAALFVSAGPRDREQVALTFHVSGDAGLAVMLLDVLHAHGVPITAFMVGNWLDANHDLVPRFVNDGHEIANHTYTHPTFPSLDRPGMTSEVDQCRDAITRLTGNGGRYFRPSGTANGTDVPTAVVLEVAGTAGYPTVAGYDVDPADYQDPGATAVSQRTLASVRPGSIVSMHFGHRGTIEALPEIVTRMRDRGLTPVTMSALLA